MSSAIAFSGTGGGPSGGGGMPAKLEHAYLELRLPPAKGTAAPGPRIGQIDFQFNPTELSVTKKAKWKKQTQPNSKRSGVPQYLGPEPSSLTLEMFFDSTTSGNNLVVQRVEELFACCVPTDATRQQGSGAPRLVVFRWGGLTGFTAYISSVAVKFTLFTPGGTPIRAVCTVTLEEFAGETAKQNPTSGGWTARDGHQLVAGDTLQSVAARAYGDPNAWRAIAEANGIDDPMRLRMGTTLLLPPAEELADGGGRIA